MRRIDPWLVHMNPNSLKPKKDPNPLTSGVVMNGSNQKTRNFSEIPVWVHIRLGMVAQK